MEKRSTPVHLTLDDYDAPGHENHPYILTSPRSLRACARLGIKPVELLPKSFSDFKRGLDLTGLLHTSLSEAYAEYEAQREEKLCAAKGERAKLKHSEQRLQWQETATMHGSTKNKQEKKKNLLINPAELPEKDQRILGTLQNHLAMKAGGGGGGVLRGHKQGELEEKQTLPKDKLHTAQQASRREELKLKHEEHRLRFEHNQHYKNMNNTATKLLLAQYMEDRHRFAEERYQKMRAKREAHIRKSRENRLLRSLECRLASACLEDSFEKWRNEIDIRGKHSLERAHHTVQQAKAERCSQLRQDREERERNYIASRERVDRENMAKLEDRERKMKKWKERVDTLDKQKMTEVQKSRAMANYSARLRNSLKEYTSENSFADMCQQAKMYAALEGTK